MLLFNLLQCDKSSTCTKYDCNYFIISLFSISEVISSKEAKCFPKVKEIEEKRSVVMFPSLSRDVSQTKQQLGSKKLHNYLDRTI